MALMTWPLTSDGAGAVTYTANEWRTLLTNLFTEGILGASSFEVTERAAGANMTLDIAAGVAILAGDDAAGQGHYIVRDDAADTEAVTIGTANPTNPRIDLVGIQLRDPSEGGASGRDCIFSVVAGTAAASPTAPTAPDSFLVLAQVTVPAGATSIVDANITDARVHSTLVHEDVIAPGSIETADLADDAVTTAKIAAANVTSTELASNAVTTAKITDANVTEAKLATAVLSSSPTAVTYQSGYGAHPSATGLQYKKVGNMVYVWGGFRRTSGSGEIIAILPSGFRPADSIFAMTISETPKGMAVTTGGNITIDAPVTGTSYSTQIVFAVA